MGDKEDRVFGRSQAYRSLRTLTKFYSGKEKAKVGVSSVEIFLLLLTPHPLHQGVVGVI